MKEWTRKAMSSIKSALREARSPAARQQRRALLRLQELEKRDCPSTVTWTGPDGGNWTTPGNWSTGTVPAATDDVVFNGSYSQGSCYVTNGSNSQLANSITLQGAYQGTLHLGQSYPTGVGPGGVELDGGAIEQDSGQPIYDGGD